MKNKITDYYDILNTNYQVGLKNTFLFEFTSWFGRKFLNKIQHPDNKTMLLDLGTGANYREGWVHADFFLTPRLKFWKRYNKRLKPDWMLDLRYPLNCDANVWDGVYTGHTLEHLYPNDAYNLIKEIYRTLKPSAWLRVNVPDLEKYIRYYNGEVVNEKFNKFRSGCEAIRSLTQDLRHLSVWDKDLLARFLKNAGFINIKVVNYMEGTDERLIKEEEVRKWETLYMEAQKPNR